MDATQMYSGGGHSGGWWAVYLTIEAIAVFGLMALLIIGVHLAYRPSRHHH
ncbi:hypothetical protein ACFP3Q_04155 [Nocardioides sp. GCM10027113]|uniref:hypothetical protein n=1 Tax=unclassified Nocardioides TaxID=2615069 RepID=UPI00361E03E5